MVTIRVPTVLRSATGGAGSVDVPGGTVEEALNSLAALHPGVRDRLFDESGVLRRFINVFVDEEDIRFADGLSTAVGEGQTVSILPAVAGGGGI